MCMSNVGAKTFIKEAKEVKGKATETSSSSVANEMTQAQEVPTQSIKDKANVSKASKFDPANVDIGKFIDQENEFPINSKDIGKLGGKIDKEELNRILHGIAQRPSEIIEDVRASKGNERNDALLNFQSKLDKMGEKDLKAMRNYLVQEMASPKNKDDELLGALAGKVNAELDSRSGSSIGSWSSTTKALGEEGGSGFPMKPGKIINSLDLEGVNQASSKPHANSIKETLNGVAEKLNSHEYTMMTKSPGENQVKDK